MQQNDGRLDDDDLIDIEAVCRLIGGEKSPIHAATFYRGVAAGRFPPPIKIGALSRWRRRRIQESIRQLEAEGARDA